jgi:glutathione S-transferase
MVHGDWFSNETRTILIMLKMANAEHDFKEINQFSGEYKDEEYRKVNPT